MMQRRANLAAILRGRRRRRDRRTRDPGDRLVPKSRERQRMVMPAEQDRLDQDGENAEQRDPAAHAGIQAKCHGFSAAAAPFSATRRRRQAWVVVTNVVTPMPTTMNSTSRNGRPIT